MTAVATQNKPANGKAPAQPASTALAIKLDEPALAAIDSIVGQCNMAAIATVGRVKQALLMAAGIRALEAILTDNVMQDVMKLQGTKLGFRCDKEYSVPEVRSCLIEALLRGLWPVGNEFNIIASTMYITKEGFTHLLREFPGLTDLKLSPGVPLVKNGGVVVSYDASWKLNGHACSMHRDIPIKVNNGMGADAILGKAERKMRCSIYNEITGSNLSEGDVDDGVEVPPKGTQTLEDLTKKLAGSEVAGLPADEASQGDAADETSQDQPAQVNDWRESLIADHEAKLTKPLVKLLHAGKFKTLGDIAGHVMASDHKALGLTPDQLIKVSDHLQDVLQQHEMAASGA